MQTVGGVIERAKKVLQESGTGIRWKDSELIGWLNEAYIAVATMRPDAHSIVAEVTLEQGARQALPADGLVAMEVLAGDSGRAAKPATRRMLTTMRPNWQSEKPSRSPEFYVLDTDTPTAFWLYPPAAQGSKAEIVYAATPAQHSTDQLATIATDALSVADRYATAVLDFMLYRAYAKDAETPANFQRSQSHYQAFASMMSGKAQGDSLAALAGGANDA